MPLTPQEATDAFRLLRDRDENGLQTFLSDLGHQGKLADFHHWYSSMRDFIDRAILKAMEKEEIEKGFDAAMMRIYVAAQKELGYDAKRYHQMLMQYRGVETAQRLLDDPQISDGLAFLLDNRRPDLSVEWLVSENPRYHVFFTDEQIRTAKQRVGRA